MCTRWQRAVVPPISECLDRAPLICMHDRGVMPSSNRPTLALLRDVWTVIGPRERQFYDCWEEWATCHVLNGWFGKEAARCTEWNVYLVDWWADTRLGPDGLVHTSLHVPSAPLIEMVH